MEWITLSELADKPIIRWLIQMIRRKVRQSIEGKIEISLLECDAVSSQYWCPLIFTLKIDSKTPARLRIIGTEYIIFHKDSPIQSGFWNSRIPLDTSGYNFENASEIIDIKSNWWNRLKVSLNPVMLGRWPSSNERWAIKGVVYIDCSYGIINKRFETGYMNIDTKRWEEAKSSFKQRFPELNYQP